MFRLIRRVVRGIRWRIALPYTFLLIITMAGIGMYVSRLIRQIHLDSLQSSLISQAGLIGESTAAPLQGLVDGENLDALARHWAGLAQARVTIISADGVVLGESQEDREEMENHLTRPEIQAALSSGSGVSIRYSQTAGIDMLYAAVPIRWQGDVIGFSRVALPLDQVENDLGRFQRNILVFSLVLVGIAIILGLWIADRTTRPVRQLSETVSEMAEGNLAKRLYSQTQDEIGQLTGAIDSMAQQLNFQITELQSEESKLSAVLEQMTDGVVMVDQTGEVVLVNQKAARLFEVDPAGSRGHSLIQVLKNHQFVNLWKDCLASGEEQSAIVEMYHPRRFVQGIASPLGEFLAGNILLLFQDLTNVRRLETVRRDFISNISHELRTPLASLKALAETLQTGALNDPPAAERFIKQIEVEVDSLNQMTSELLELARIESREIQFSFTSISPCQVMSQGCERLRLQAERAQLTLTLDCDTALPPIKADPSRLEQVFVNLVHNAIKFTPPGGSIQVTASSRNDHIQFSIRDTGAGIPANDLPRIFERFYKTDKARSSGGTGLGLAIAKHLVEAHGGKIWAESWEGQGSVFFFEIPTAE
jgi:two-component system phosphate regulon sensor histidine kinase PhoR